LSAVARYLAEKAAPAGVEVVASAPRYRILSAEANLVADPAADSSKVLRNFVDQLNAYLHPLHGDKGDGWGFGQTLVWPVLLRRLLSSVPGLRAISKLRLFVDGVPQERCRDVALGVGELFWPANHTLNLVEEGRP
jgi:hypothetical protein